MSAVKKPRRELTLGDKVKLINASKDNSHRKLAEIFDIGKTQVCKVFVKYNILLLLELY